MKKIVGFQNKGEMILKNKFIYDEEIVAITGKKGYRKLIKNCLLDITYLKLGRLVYYPALDSHINFLNIASVNAAIKLKKDVREYLIILKQLVINKRYILIYFIVKNNIFIDAILDSRQNNNYYLI